MAPPAAAELTWRTNAASHLLDARKRSSARLGSRKSRSGCTTCKARRVKCDEARPKCQRCLSGGRECEYAIFGTETGNDVAKGVVDEVVQGSVGGPSRIGRQLAKVLGLRDADRRTFDYFLSWTAPRLGGPWDREFWCNNVLQLAQQESFVLDSLLAISVLYEHPQFLSSFTGRPGESPTPDFPGTSFEGPKQNDEHHQHALRLYNRAIKGVMERMQTGTANHVLALLSCVLFVCIETIRDNVLAAMTLFVQGTELLKQVDQHNVTSGEREVLGLVRHIFQRMAVQAVLYGQPSGAALRTSVTEGEKEGFEAYMTSMTEARGALFAAALNSHSFVQQADSFRQAVLDSKLNPPNGSANPSFSLDPAAAQAAQYPDPLKNYTFFDPTPAQYLNGIEIFGMTQDTSSMFFRTSDDDACEADLERNGALNTLEVYFKRLGPDSNMDVFLSHKDLLMQQEELLCRLQRWLASFQELRKHSTREDPEAVSYLLMYYHAAYIWLRTRLASVESVYDSLTSSFQELVHHAGVFVRAKAFESPTFTFEMGAVMPLTLVASKCRIPSLRRQALDLILMSPKKESTFGAYSCAQVICRLITIEEEGLDLPLPKLDGRSSAIPIDDSVQPAENARVHSFDLLKRREKQTYELRATRYMTLHGNFERVIEDFPI